MGSEPVLIDANAVIDDSRIRPLHVLVAVLGACVLVADGFDTLVIGYIAPQIAKDWNIQRDMLGTVFSASLFGVLVGYLLLSPLAGRFGPKRVVVLCMGMLAAFTLFSAQAGSTETLIAWRFLTGLGLGGSLPGAVALTGEFCPKRWRSTFITLMYLGFSIGQITAGTAANLLLDSHGWRMVLRVGAAVPFTLMLVLLAALPESIEFLVNTGRDPARVLRLLRRLAPDADLPEGARVVAGQAERAVSVTELFRAGRSVGTAAIWTAMFMNLVINYFAQYWLTKLLVEQGVAQSVAITATTMTMWGGIPTAFIIGPLMDRLGAYRVIVSLFLACAVFSALIGLYLRPPLDIPLIMAGCFGLGFCMSSGQKSLSALGVHFYPVALRSTGIGWAFGIGRAGAMLGASGAGILLSLGWHPAGLFFLATLAPLIAAGASFAMSRHYGGRTEGHAAVPAEAGLGRAGSP